MDKELLQLFGNHTGLEQRILNDIKKEIDTMFSDSKYYLHLIGEIVLNAQKFEICLRKYLGMNKVKESNIWQTGKLITITEEKGFFTAQEVETLRKIVEYRNWVVHKLYKQETKGLLFNEYRNSKLVITKHMIYEAIDFVNDKIEKISGRSGVANIINDSHNI
jgi:hypothetical protein